MSGRRDTYVIFRRRIVPLPDGGLTVVLEVADMVVSSRRPAELLAYAEAALAGRGGGAEHPPFVWSLDHARSRYPDLISEAERTIRPTLDRLPQVERELSGQPRHHHQTHHRRRAAA